MSQHGCPERLSNRSKGFQEENAGQATMEVLVETLTGTAFEMTVSPSDTIFAIKSKIFRVEGIPVSQQHLVYNLKELDDAASLRALGIADGARLRLVLGMRGGPISTRRLPPPPSDLGGELERLLNTGRYRESGGCDGAGAAGCKVTVLVFRDGERVNMLRVRENRDGSLQPLDHHDYASSLAPARGAGGAGAGGAGARDNAVTMNKMLELRRRMESLSVQRKPAETRAEIQKTRSEETLSVASVAEPCARYGEADDAFTPLYDGHYTRYDYDCSFADRYTLLPPIGSRAESEQSVDRLQAEGGPLVSEAGLEPRRPPPAPRADTLQPVAADYGPLVGGWRARFGSSSALAPAPRALSAAAALFSSSTSDLETLTRTILPLSRHRNREHLHLSDEGLDAGRGRAPEAGGERRQRRIKKIAELESARLFRFGDDCGDAAAPPEPPAPPGPPGPPAAREPKKPARLRCGLCRKRLSVATVHRCRCGAEFCAPHRYAEVHGCAYDYKAEALPHLQRANPLVSAPKLPKI